MNTQVIHHPVTIPFLRVTRNQSNAIRFPFQIDARGDIQSRIWSMASGDSSEAVVELARRRTMLDIIQNAVERRQHTNPIALVHQEQNPLPTV